MATTGETFGVSGPVIAGEHLWKTTAFSTIAFQAPSGLCKEGVFYPSFECIGHRFYPGFPQGKQLAQSLKCEWGRCFHHLNEGAESRRTSRSSSARVVAKFESTRRREFIFSMA